MNREFWLDGFNFFHHWESTRELLRPDSGYDIVRAIERSIRITGKRLGNKCRYTVIYLDGGLSRHETRLAALRIRYAGPGKKADDRMVEDLALLDGQARLVTAISNDRELKARLRAHGASCLSVGEYLATFEGNKGGGGNRKGGKPGGRGQGAREDAEVLREKCRSLSETEVEAWLDYFGGEAGEDGGDEA